MASVWPWQEQAQRTLFRGWVTSKDLLERGLMSRFQSGQKKEGKEQS